MNEKPKLFRITTIPGSLGGLLKGQLNFMNQHMDVYGVCAEGNGEIFEVGEREGIKVLPVEMTRQITPLKDLKSVYTLYKLLKKHKPHIVHTHTPKAGIVGMLSAWLAGIPLRLHDSVGLPLLEETGIKRKILDFVETLTYSFATHVFPNSFGLREIILKNGYAKAHKLKVLGDGSSNGTNTTFFDKTLINEAELKQLKKELNISKKDTVFVFIGRLVTDKGINELVSAFTQLEQTNHALKLILVGPHEPILDPLLPETEKAIENSKNIIPVGVKKDVRPYYAIADAFVFPSYREGFPNVVMEACAMELPCIVSDINGNNEIIIHGQNGLIFPPKDTKALLEAMERFLESPDTIFSMDGKASRKQMIEKYDCKKIWEYILKEYHLLLNEKGVEV